MPKTGRFCILRVPTKLKGLFVSARKPGKSIPNTNKVVWVFETAYLCEFICFLKHAFMIFAPSATLFCPKEDSKKYKLRCAPHKSGHIANANVIITM